jgi:hypothetical protein
MITFAHADQSLMDELKQMALQQLKPNPPKNGHAWFLKDFVDTTNLRPESVHSFVSEWLESVVESDRKKRCQSDNHLLLLDDPVSRQLTRSAPEIVYDAHGFAVPRVHPTLASTRFSDIGSIAPSDAGSSRSSGRSLVEDPYYRYRNLASNNISMRNPDERFPDDVANIVRHVGKNRNSPGPSLDQVRCDADLYQLEMEGVNKSGVECYFHAHIFPRPKALDSLKHSKRQPMAKHTVSSNPGSTLKVSSPIPDMLYGYNCHTAFPQQQAQIVSMGNEPMANTEGLIYPFFVIEFKGNSGDLWVATNQCLG